VWISAGSRAISIVDEKEAKAVFHFLSGMGDLGEPEAEPP
jgi:hydrogenase maturation factor